MLAKSIASDNHQSARPPRLILIDAPLSSRLSRYNPVIFKLYHSPPRGALLKSI